MSAYSVLSHEAIIDVTWDNAIQPLLLAKFPGATNDELNNARAYAYGGCLVPDMGYYPRGHKFFTDLIHYVRTGDLVDTLLQEARDINEYAFALGMLCHYYTDKYGHPIGVNPNVPRIYPEDKEKYGHYVTYEQDPVSHIRVEFSFDVVQTARGNYASENYHRFIGFKVATSLLERGFVKIYGLEINSIYKDFDRSTETFRWVTKQFFPAITRVAWSSKKGEIKKANPTITRRKFEYRIRRTNYYREFGKKHEKPGFVAGAVAICIKVLPKIGPLKYLKLKIPGPEEEKLFIQSFDTVVKHYSIALKKTSADKHHLYNIDYDTGEETSPGEYGLADKTYQTLLLKLKADNFKNVNKDLKQNIILFFSQCNEPMAADAGKDWVNITAALNELRALKTYQIYSSLNKKD